MINGTGWFTLLIVRRDELRSVGLCFGYRYIGIAFGTMTARNS